MQDRFKYTDRLVITFVIMGFVLLIGFSALVMIKNKTLTNKVYYQTILDEATGLSSKPPIYFKGFQIGRIDEFELDSATNNILVKFYVYENYSDKIIKYAVISRIENLILGTSNQYEILLPTQELISQLEPLEEGGLVPFYNSEMGQEYARKGKIAVKFDSIESILTSVNNILLNLQKESDSEAGAIFQILEKFSTIADSLQKMADQAEKEQLIPEFKKTLVALQAMIDRSDAVFARAEIAITNLDEAAKHADTVLVAYENPAEIIANATDHKLPNMIDNVDVNLVYIQGILKEVHLQREQLAEAIILLNKTMATFEKTLQGVNSNPLLKDGIEADNKTENDIEINEN